MLSPHVAQGCHLVAKVNVTILPPHDACFHSTLCVTTLSSAFHTSNSGISFESPGFNVSSEKLRCQCKTRPETRDVAEVCDFSKLAQLIGFLFLAL